METSNRERSIDTAVVMQRTPEDTIEVVLPPVVLACTFLMFARSHHPIACDLINSMAYHMNNENIKEIPHMKELPVDIVLDFLKTRHRIPEWEEGAIHAGTPEMFDGMYYGEFQPIELAGMCDVAAELMEGIRPDENMTTILATLKIWLNARALVKPNEYFALGEMGTA